MKFLVCLILSVALINSVSAYGRAGAVKQRLSSAATKVRDFFRPTSDRHSGLQNTIAGLTALGLACTSVSGVTGCAARHSSEHRGAVEATQNLLIYGGTAALTLGLVGTILGRGGGDSDRPRRATRAGDFLNNVFVVVPLAAIFVGYLWQESTIYTYESYESSLQSPTHDTLQANKQIASNADLRAYFREHLTPKTYHNMFDDPAHQNAWVAIPISSQLLEEQNPTNKIMKNIEDADEIYYGFLQNNNNVDEDLIFKFDTIKHADTGIAQTLPENEAFTVVSLKQTQK